MKYLKRLNNKIRFLFNFGKVSDLYKSTKLKSDLVDIRLHVSENSLFSLQMSLNILAICSELESKGFSFSEYDISSKTIKSEINEFMVSSESFRKETKEIQNNTKLNIDKLNILLSSEKK